MVRALKLENDLFVIIENIVRFKFLEKEIWIHTVDNSHFLVQLDKKSRGCNVGVSIDEFKRIKRELCEYTGISEI